MNREYQDDEVHVRGDAAEAVRLAFGSVIARIVLHNYEVAEAVGLSARDMQALHLLQLRGPMTPGQLGGALGLASASTTALIDRLESAGYAKRERDLIDRRKLAVSLVDERLARDLAPRYAEQAQRLNQTIDRFDTEELDTIRRFLSMLSGVD